MYKFRLLILLLVAGTRLLVAETVVIPGLGKPNSIKLYKDRLYVAGQGSISIYSFPDARLIKTFGRVGEGPGEFKISPVDKIGLRFVVRQEHIMVNSWGKLSIFSREGKFIEEKKVIENSLAQSFQPLGSKYVGFDRAMVGNAEYYFVNFYDQRTLTKEKEIHRLQAFLTRSSINPLRLALLLKDDTQRGPLFHVYGDRLFVEGEGCRIWVYDRQGKALISFSVHDYEKLQVAEDFKKEVMAFLEKRLITAFSHVKRNGRFPQYFPLLSLQAADGKVYVQTFKRKMEKSEFYIFDLDGKFLRKTMVPFRESEFLCAYPFTIANEKIYQLFESSNTDEWVLSIDKI